MPRTFDFVREDRRGGMARVPRDTIFPLLPTRADTGSEVSLNDMWPNGFSLSGRMHQFDLEPPKGTWPYDNALVDPVYEWMVENLRGRWNWFEQETNHGHSVSTDVWIDDPDEIAAFRERWGHLFTTSDRKLERDAKAREAEGVSAPAP